MPIAMSLWKISFCSTKSWHLFFVFVCSGYWGLIAKTTDITYVSLQLFIILGYNSTNIRSSSNHYQTSLYQVANQPIFLSVPSLNSPFLLPSSPTAAQPKHGLVRETLNGLLSLMPHASCRVVGWVTIKELLLLYIFFTLVKLTQPSGLFVRILHKYRGTEAQLPIGGYVKPGKFSCIWLAFQKEDGSLHILAYAQRDTRGGRSLHAGLR